MVKRRPGMSRKKFEIKPIRVNKVRVACFSNRHTTIFNKAKELAILCGAMFAAVFFSPSDRGFSFGYPSVSVVGNRFLADDVPNNSITSSSTQHGTDEVIREIERKERELIDELQAYRNQSELLREEIARASDQRVMYLLQTRCEELELNDLKELKKLLTSASVLIEERMNIVLQNNATQAHVVPKP